MAMAEDVVISSLINELILEQCFEVNDYFWQLLAMCITRLIWIFLRLLLVVFP